MIILPLIGLTIGILFFILYFYLDRKDKINNKWFFRIASLLLFIVMLGKLFVRDDFDKTFNLLLVDLTTNIEASTTWLFSAGFSIFLVFSRWLTFVALVLVIVNGYYRNKIVAHVGSVLAFIMGIINLIFADANLFAVNGSDLSVLSFRGIQLILESVILISLAMIIFYKIIKDKLWLSKKEVGFALLVFIGTMAAVMPPSVPYNLIGNLGISTKNFSTTHIILLIATPITLIGSYFIFRHQKMENKRIFLSILVLSSFIVFFHQRHIGMGAIPIHLCNMAVSILLIADVFNLRGAFYFAYFANVIGAIFALFFPNNSWDANHYMAIKFAYVHLYIFIIPILGVALGRFSKPKLKDMYKAMAIFLVYFIFVAVVNAWMNNYAEVDYFYIYSDYISGLLGIRELQYDYILDIPVGDINLRFFYIYQPLYFLVYLVFMWLSWYIYDLFFQVIQENKLLKAKEKQLKLDYLYVKELLGERNIREPLNLEGIDMIKIKNLSKRYGSSPKLAVDDFSIEVNAGEIFGFIGHNGAGKTTTIKCLVGIQSFNDGAIEVCGYSIKHQPIEAKMCIGYVSDNHSVYEKLTGREYIDYVADLYNVSDEDKETRLDDMLAKLELAHAIDQEIKSYSHGMKQKLVVIASLIHKPKVWILDEPLTGLDPISSIQIKEMMQNHAKEGNIVFFSSHVVEVVEKISDRIAVISEGKLLNVFTKEELISKKFSIEEIYKKRIALE